MNVTPSAEYLEACRLVLGDDSIATVLDEIRRVHAKLVEANERNKGKALRPPRMITAVLSAGETARVADDWPCPCGCNRLVRATDIEMLDDGWRIVCPNSGLDILTVTLP
jgi:hypothetical protein